MDSVCQNDHPDMGSEYCQCAFNNNDADFVGNSSWCKDNGTCQGSSNYTCTPNNTQADAGNSNDSETEQDSTVPDAASTTVTDNSDDLIIHEECKISNPAMGEAYCQFASTENTDFGGDSSWCQDNGICHGSSNYSCQPSENPGTEQAKEIPTRSEADALPQVESKRSRRKNRLIKQIARLKILRERAGEPIPQILARLLTKNGEGSTKEKLQNLTLKKLRAIKKSFSVD